MTAYYNEINLYCAEWLRNLVAADLIAPGEVDTRSIEDVTPNDVSGFVQCHFFAGLGGWPGALRLAGWPDNRPVWTGSCPCQPFSLAGAQAGFADKRHLWPDWFWLIEKCRPPVILGEQVASAGEWLRLVRGDLEALGYAVGCIPMEAASAGADHLRDRYWFVADANDAGSQGRRVLPERASEQVAGPDGLADANGIRSNQIYPDTGRGADRDQAAEGPRLGGACDVADTGSRRSDRSGEGQGEQSRRTEAQWPSNPGDKLADAGFDEYERQRLSSGSEGQCSPDAQRHNGGSELSWVLGADGKARRVKPGIRLLAHGVPARVAKLRAFGNAIDPRPAAAFIKAVM